MANVQVKLYISHQIYGLFFRADHRYVGPLIILGPILALTGMGLVVNSLELMMGLRKQIKRVMDPNLLKTNNLHEVKHWIEPGRYTAWINRKKKVTLECCLLSQLAIILFRISKN